MIHQRGSSEPGKKMTFDLNRSSVMNSFLRDVHEEYQDWEVVDSSDPPLKKQPTQEAKNVIAMLFKSYT